MKILRLFTAISCSGPVPQKGGLGVVVCYNDARREAAYGLSNTKSSRLEILVIIKGLELLKEPCEVTVYLSNQNLINTFESGWIDRWIRKGYFSGPSEKVKNRDLLARLLELVKMHKASFVRYDDELLRSPEYKRAKQLATEESRKANLPPDEIKEPAYSLPLPSEIEDERLEEEYSEEALKEVQRKKSARGAWHSRNIIAVTEIFGNTCQHCGTHPPYKKGVAHHLSYPTNYWLLPLEKKVTDGIITFLCRDCHQKVHTADTYEDYQKDNLRHSGHCSRCGDFAPKMWKRYSPTHSPVPLCNECVKGLREGSLVIVSASSVEGKTLQTHHKIL